MTPEIRLGAEPAYATTALTPPMVTVTVCCGTFRAEATGRNDGAVDTLRRGLPFAGHIDGDDVTALLGVVDAIDRHAVLIEDGARPVPCWLSV